MKVKIYNVAYRTRPLSTTGDYQNKTVVVVMDRTPFTQRDVLLSAIETFYHDGLEAAYPVSIKEVKNINNLGHNLMLKFSTRSAARSFALKSGHKTVDLGAGTNGKRWAVKILNK